MKSFLLSLICLPLLAATPVKERFSYALFLDDTNQARSLLDELDDNDPTKTDLFFAYLAAFHSIDEMRLLFEKQTSPLSKQTLETISWAIIEKNAAASHPRLRIEALLAAAHSHDQKAIPILIRLLKDPNPHVQELALECASHFPDEPIQQLAEELTRTAPAPIKLAAAQLLIKQEAPSAKQLIFNMLSDEVFSENDRTLLISALAEMEQSSDWVAKAFSDKNSNIRQLAASYVLHHPSSELLLALIPLLNDSSSTVRHVTLEALGLWHHLIAEKDSFLKEKASSLLHSPVNQLSSTAAWMLLRLGEEPQKNLETLSKNEARILCSRVIASGTCGLQLAKRLLGQIEDPICQLNLNLYLLSHRVNFDRSVLKSLLENNVILLGEHNEGIFSWIDETQLAHHPLIPRLPESQDLLIRLRIAAALSYIDNNLTVETIAKMIEDRAWGVTAEAAALLIQEDSPCLEEVLSPLLASPIETVRIQAALLLALMTESQAASDILCEEFDRSSKEGKETLLLGFAALTSDKTIEKLTPLLVDRSPILQTRAAGVLLCSLYK